MTSAASHAVAASRQASRGANPNRLIEASDLPPIVRDVIRLVVRRTGLSTIERADVARELIAHFQDGLKGSHTPEHLVGAFGDPTNAAALIRRAKLRQRPWRFRVYRAVGKSAFVVFAVLLSAYIIMGVCVWNAKPTILRNYLTEINAKVLAVPHQDRALPMLTQAAAMLSAAPPPTPISGPIVPGDERWGELAAYLIENAAALDLMRRANEKPGFGLLISPYDAERSFFPADLSDDIRAITTRFDFENESMVLSASWAHSRYLRQCSHLLVADARLAFHQNDPRRAVHNLRAAARLATYALEVPSSISVSSSAAMVTNAISAISEWLTAKPDVFSDEHLIELDRVLRDADAALPNSPDLTFDRAIIRDFIQSNFSDDGAGDGLPLQSIARLFFMNIDPSLQRPGYRNAAFFAPLFPLLIAGRAEQEREVDRYFTAIASQGSLPPWDRDLEAMSDEFDLLRDRWQRIRLIPFAEFAPPGFGSLQRVTLATAHRDAAILGVALERARRADGSYPSTLDTLVPRFIDVVPLDPADGKPLRYTLRDSGPVIYSVGMDRRDDNAAPLSIEGKPVRRPRFEHLVISKARLDQLEAQSPDSIARGDFILWPTKPDDDDNEQ